MDPKYLDLVQEINEQQVEYIKNERKQRKRKERKAVIRERWFQIFLTILAVAGGLLVERSDDVLAWIKSLWN